MTSDIRLNDDAVVVDGALGIGVEAPRRTVHVEGSEIHSGGPGAGLSFADRTASAFVDVPGKGERWVWYAQGRRALLWSGADAVSIGRAQQPGQFDLTVTGSVQATGLKSNVLDAFNIAGSRVVTQNLTAALAELDDVRAKSLSADSLRGARLDNCVAHRLLGTAADGATIVNCRSEALALSNPAAPEVQKGPVTELAAQKPADVRTAPPPGAGAAGPGTEPGPGPVPIPQTPLPPRLALYHEFGSGVDRLVLNHLGRYVGGVRVQGNLHTTGAATQGSSMALKDDVEELPPDDALAALQGLNPVTYTYKDDPDRVRRVGFVAETVPDLVAEPGRDRLSAMDILAVVTGVVRGLQRTVDQLAAEVADLRRATHPTA